MSGELGAIAISITLGCLIISFGLGTVSNSLDRIAKALETEDNEDEQ